MANYLGISTTDNLIKYAKVGIENNNINVKAFGTKVYDDLNKALSEVIDETVSHNIPICMNLDGEIYNYFSVFNMLKKKDIEAALKSDFEILCNEKDYNYNAFESKYLLTEDVFNKEMLKAIYISIDKGDFITKINKLEKNKVGNFMPLSIALNNLLQSEKENYAIVNIEDKTQITSVVNGEIDEIDTLNFGMKDVILGINEKENSIKKSYDICKNTTIYTMETMDMQYEENIYLKDIMPVLYKIVTEVKEKLENKLATVRKIYITGEGALINNIDLYFQEYFPAYKCEILAPFFIDKLSKEGNVKDYIEVNSAIALALYEVSGKYKDIVFKNKSVKTSEKGTGVKGMLSKEISFKDLNLNFDFKLSGPLSNFEMNSIRAGVFGILCMSVFGVESYILGSGIDKKNQEVTNVINETNSEISLIKNNTTKVNEKGVEYSTRTTKLASLTSQVVEDNKYKKAIPILLNRIMSTIPKEVTLTSIENNVDGKIIINAEAENYDELGYFKATLKTKNILKNITSDSSIKIDNIVKVTIEGELP